MPTMPTMTPHMQQAFMASMMAAPAGGPYSEWACLGTRLVVMHHPTGCPTCDAYRAHYRAGQNESQFQREMAGAHEDLQRQLVDHLRDEEWIVVRPEEEGTIPRVRALENELDKLDRDFR